MKPIIICVVGPSGSGKTTAVGFASKALGIPVVRSYTTRPMRDGETQGVEHIFVSNDEVPKREDMIAYTYFGGYEYWATKEQVDCNLVNLYVIDEVGLQELIKRFEHVYDIRSIYVKPSFQSYSMTDAERLKRDEARSHLPMRYYDHTITNNGTLESFLYSFTNAIWQLN